MKIILLFNFVIFYFVALNAQKVNEPFRAPEQSSWQTNINNLTKLNKFNTTESISPKNPIVLRKLNAEMMHFKEIEFFWLDDGEQEAGWEYTGTGLLSRSANGWITSKLMIDTVNNVILNKVDYYQDQFGNDTLSITSGWNDTDSVFVPSAKQVSIYDPQSHELIGEIHSVDLGGEWFIIQGWKTINIYQGELLTQTTEYSWDFFQLVWVAESRTINEYMGNNLIRETFQEKVDSEFPPFKRSGANITVDQYDDSKLRNYEKSEYEYTNNIITTLNTFIWDEDEWIPEFRYTNVIWHDISKLEPISYDQYNYDMGAWILTERYENTYTVNSTENRRYLYNSVSQGFELEEKILTEISPNGSIIFTEFTETEAGIFVASSRNSLSYDDRGNFIGTSGENYDFVESVWVLTFATKSEYTYDNADLLVRVIMSLFNEGEWTNMTRTDYLNYADISVSTRLNPVESLIAYPNPTNGLVTLKTAGTFSGSLISVFDLTGRKVMEKVLSEDQVTIDLSGHAKGMYVIRVENKSVMILLK